MIHGPAGIGKSLLLQSTIKTLKALNPVTVVQITPAVLIEGGEQIAQVKQAFKRAEASKPSLLVVEEVDFIAKNKDLFYVFLAQLDAYDGTESLVLATTNKLAEIDKALRRGGRLDIDIRLDMPSADDRYQVLTEHLTSVPNTVTSEDLKMMAAAASGFVCSDLAQIVRNARLAMIKDKAETVSKGMLEAAILEAKPLSIADLLVEVPKTLWSEIGGNDQIKFQVR